MNEVAEILVREATIRLQRELIISGMNKRVIITLVTPEVTPKMLIEYMAKVMDISTQELTKKTRKPYIVERRQICMLMLQRFFTSLTLHEIARLLNLGDHSTIIHGLNKAKNMIDTKDPVFYSNYLTVLNKVSEWMQE